MLNNRNIFSFPMIFIHCLAFIVLWEWLRPLPVITDTGNLYVFIWFTLFCFIVMYIRLASYISIPLIFIVMMYSLHIIFFEGSFFRNGLSTLVRFGEDFSRNVEYVVSNELNSLSFEFRTFLLLLVLAIISYLIHFWLCYVKKIFYFLLLTVIYVTILDTFTIYDASHAIVRIVVVGFLLMTLLYKMRLEEKEQLAGDEFKGKAWTNTVTVIIIFVALIAFFSPKFAPFWPDPIPMVRGAVTGEGVGTVRSIGYGQNDERLGGGFNDDDTVVFRATAEQAHYWRGESKEIYTGKGWQSIEHELNKTFRYSDFYDSKVAVEMYESNTLMEKKQVTISMEDENQFWHFFYPGELIEVEDQEFYSKQDEFRYIIDYVSGKVGTTSEEGEPLFLKEYTLSYNSPKFVIDELKNSSQDDPGYIRDVYLQLPDIPERVGQLATQITEAYENRYDKVKAIEGYFSKNGFEYETKDVAIPAEDQDYVDQFLFETQKGYCDNYSTSMVVMLRTLDIPARWVKGFTQGELVSRLDVNVYEVSNANAHSWVEVYFPNVGWVPFEPTKGFDSTFVFIEEPSETDSLVEDNNSQGEVSRPQRDPENPFLPLEDNLDTQGDGALGSIGQNNGLDSFKFSFKLVWIIVVITLIGFSFYKNHQKLITIFFLYFFKWKSIDKNPYAKAYERLLWLLELHGYQRYNDETLREYADRIDGLFSSSEMRILTLRYEKLYYGNVIEKHSWKETKQLWEVLVKKLSS